MQPLIFSVQATPQMANGKQKWRSSRGEYSSNAKEANLLFTCLAKLFNFSNKEGCFSRRNNVSLDANLDLSHVLFKASTKCILTSWGVLS